jgi:mono/diheme cytochrome c family protein
MNYPIWDIPASGLLIAGVAIIHVFISHFAIGGGLFLVLFELKARREGDSDLLGYVQLHSRFFLLLTLVMGAVTGVGIWFTVGLVHPQATSTLIQVFVWAWAIEWVFFFVEIAAAMVYYYGWGKLSPKSHLTVGWIYFVAGWMSLFVINGILTFMLTPGGWLGNRSLIDGFFNPTFWPSLVGRTLVAIGLAGVYALFTSSFLKNPELKKRIARYSATRWVLPAALLLPFSVAWYLGAALSAGVPVAGVLGSQSNGFFSIVSAILMRSSSSGYPVAQTAALISIGACVLIIVLTLGFAVVFTRGLRPVVAGLILACGLMAFGGSEWVREDLRKPYVIGQYMFVNGIRLPSRTGLGPSSGNGSSLDSFSIQNTSKVGVLQVSKWITPSGARDDDTNDTAAEPTDNLIVQGRQVFKLLCSSCHTVGGHLGIRPLVEGQSRESVQEVLSNLARPVNSIGESTSWSDPNLQLSTWKGRRMPPFAGTVEEMELVSHYLVSLGSRQILKGVSIDRGQRIFETKCFFCHASEADWPMERLAPDKTADEFYEKIARLPEVNPIMPPFGGTDEERRLLAEYLAARVASTAAGEEEK